MNKNFKDLYAKGCRIGVNVVIPRLDLVNLYGCEIKSNTTIAPFVEIQKDVVIGNNCKISSHSFICTGVTIQDYCFIGHGVMFTNDKLPRVMGEWKLEKTVVERGVSIGSGVTILPGLTIGRGSLIGAGSVVTKDVKQNTIVAGNPARVIKDLSEE